MQFLSVGTHRLLPWVSQRRHEILLSSFTTFFSCSSSLTNSHNWSPRERLWLTTFGSRWALYAPPDLLSWLLCYAIERVEQKRVRGVHQRRHLPEWSIVAVSFLYPQLKTIKYPVDFVGTDLKLVTLIYFIFQELSCLSSFLGLCQCPIKK